MEIDLKGCGKEILRITATITAARTWPFAGCSHFGVAAMLNVLTDSFAIRA
jgi:hypothetical protein